MFYTETKFYYDIIFLGDRNKYHVALTSQYF